MKNKHFNVTTLPRVFQQTLETTTQEDFKRKMTTFQDEVSKPNPKLEKEQKDNRFWTKRIVETVVKNLDKSVEEMMPEQCNYNNLGREEDDEESCDLGSDMSISSTE
jgi:hypothetical protein